MTVSSVGSSSLTQQLLQLQQSMFATADADSDGSLSLSEFQSIGQNVQGGGQPPPPPPMGGSSSSGANFSSDTLRSLMSVQMLGSDSGAILSSGDTNSDGLMSADEISSALASNAPEGAKGLGLEDKMASDMIAALDTDADGSLSSDEIASGLSASQSAMQAMGGMRGPPPGGGAGGPPPSGGGGGGGGSSSATGSSGVFESLDTNQDGTVSAAELAAANADDTDAASAAADLISASDTDGDGALSGSEFATMLDSAKSSSSTTSAASTSSLLSSSTLASDLMSKLLAQLDTALASKSGLTSTLSATA